MMTVALAAPGQTAPHSVGRATVAVKSAMTTLIMGWRNDNRLTKPATHIHTSLVWIGARAMGIRQHIVPGRKSVCIRLNTQPSIRRPSTATRYNSIHYVPTHTFMSHATLAHVVLPLRSNSIVAMMANRSACEQFNIFSH